MVTKMVAFESLGTVSYLHSIATIFTRFDTIHEWRPTSQPDTARRQAALMHSIARPESYIDRRKFTADGSFIRDSQRSRY